MSKASKILLEAKGNVGKGKKVEGVKAGIGEGVKVGKEGKAKEYIEVSGEIDKLEVVKDSLKAELLKEMKVEEKVVTDIGTVTKVERSTIEDTMELREQVKKTGHNELFEEKLLIGELRKILDREPALEKFVKMNSSFSLRISGRK